MGFRMRGSSSLDALTIYTNKKNKFISDISCLQTYYTRWEELEKEGREKKRILKVYSLKILVLVHFY